MKYRQSPNREPTPMHCELRSKTDEYEPDITDTIDIYNDNICRYKTYDIFYDEYICFISASNYKQIHETITNSTDEKNIACSYCISGRFDFVVKLFHPRNSSPKHLTIQGIKNIRRYKVVDRFARQGSHLVKMLNTSCVFYNMDVNLSRYHVFADFIEIKPSKGKKLTDDLINAINNSDILQHIYVVYKLKNIENNACVWLICLRYKCYEYSCRQLFQMKLDSFVDARKHIKTTYISNNSNIRTDNIKMMFDNMHYENVIGRVLCTDNIRRLTFKTDKRLASAMGKNKYLDKLRNLYKDFYNNLLGEVRNYSFYLSYKQEDEVGNISGHMCNFIYSWFDVNGFENVYRAEERISCGDNIKEFMKDLGKSDLVVFCISDKFFNAPNCMYELLLVVQNNKDVQNFIKEKMIFITSKFFLNNNKRNEIKEYWRKKLLQEQNNMDKEISFTIMNNLDFIDKISDVQQIELIKGNSEALHYEKAIEAILTNIVEKVLKNKQQR